MFFNKKQYSILFQAILVFLVHALILSNVSFAIEIPQSHALAPPLASNPPCQVCKAEDGGCYLITDSDIISHFRNKWTFYYISCRIKKALEKQISQYTLIDKIKKHITKRNGMEEVKLLGLAIDGIEEMHDDKTDEGKITSFSLPVKKDGELIHNLIYSLEDKDADATFEFKDGKRVCVRVESVGISIDETFFVPDTAKGAVHIARAIRHDMCQFHFSHLRKLLEITLPKDETGSEEFNATKQLLDERIKTVYDVLENYTKLDNWISDFARAMEAFNRDIRDEELQILIRPLDTEGAKFIRAIIKGIQIFYSTFIGENPKKTIDLKDMLEILSYRYFRYNEDYKLNFRCDEAARYIFAPEGDVYRALLNLIYNAHEAIDRKVTRIIEQTHSIPKFEEKINIDISREKDHSVIRINDTGPGMPKEAFEAFKSDTDRTWSSKGERGGRGLRVAKILIERNGGTIEVESEPGKGTTFIIRLPIAKGGTKAGSGKEFTKAKISAELDFKEESAAMRAPVDINKTIRKKIESKLEPKYRSFVTFEFAESLENNKNLKALVYGTAEVNARPQDKLNSLVRIILANAFDFIDKGIHITIKTFVTDDGRPAISLRDTGPGISFAKIEERVPYELKWKLSDKPYLLSRIFEGLTTKDGLKGFKLAGGWESAGAERGLYIVKEIMKKSKGRIFIETEPNIGTKFTFIFEPLKGETKADSSVESHAGFARVRRGKDADGQNEKLHIKPFSKAILEVELANWLGFAEEGKDYGFGLGDFKEAIEKGPIKDFIIDRFFESPSKGKYAMKSGLKLTDFFDFENSEGYRKVFEFYHTKGGYFFSNTLFEFWATHTSEGVITGAETVILGSFGSRIVGLYEQGVFPEFELEHVSNFEELLSIITNPSFATMQSMYSNKAMYSEADVKQEMMQIFQNLPRNQQIIIAYNALKEVVQRLGRTIETKKVRLTQGPSQGLAHELNSKVVTRLQEAIKNMENNLNTLGELANQPLSTETPITHSSLESFAEAEQIQAIRFKDAIKEIDKPTIIALGTDSLPGYDKENLPQYFSLLNPFITSIQKCCDKNKNIAFVFGEDKDLLDKIEDMQREKAGFADAKVLALAGEETARELSELKNTFAIGIDNENISEKNYIRLMEMLRILIELSKEKEITKETIEQINKEHSKLGAALIDGIVIFVLPKERPMNYEKLRDTYRLQQFA